MSETRVHFLRPRHHFHLSHIGVPTARLPYLSIPQHEYEKYYEEWKRSLPDGGHETWHERTLAHWAWAQHVEGERTAPERHAQRRKYEWWTLLAVLLLILFCVVPNAHCQFSKITYIDVQNQGSDIGFFTSPFKINFTGAGVACSNSAGTITCTVTGGSITNNPGGSNTQIQYNSSGTFGGAATGTYIVGSTKFQFQTGTHFDFNDPTDATKVVEFDASGLTTGTTRTVAFPDSNSRTIKNGVTTGQIPIWNAATGTFDVSDPLVQGTQAAASTTIPNPVVIGGSDYSGTPAVRVWKVDSSGNGYAVITFAAPQHTIIDSGTISLPSNAAQETGGNLAAIKTDVDKIPASPSTDRTTAAAPFSTELSDGAAFYVGAKTGQLPSALDGSGFLKTHEQGTAAISGTVTANIGTSGSLALDASVTGLQVSQGSTTSGQKGGLAQGAVTTAAPTYTTAQTSPLSLTTAGALRTDSSATTQPVSGTVTATQATGTNLHMVCDSGCSSSAGFADSAAFTTGTTAINPVGGLFDDTPPTAITTGHAAAARITPNRAIHINLRNQAGTEIGTSSNPVRTDPTGTTTQPISAASLPLPTGAAQDSSLITLDTDVKSNVTLHAGTNLIGKAGFDGTTPGSTNGVTQFQPARTTGTITSAASTVSVGTTGYGVATVTVNGTYAGVTINFEFSDDSGTTWYSETCTRTDTNVQENSEALPSNQTRAWDCAVYAATNFRVRASAWTSGTANIGLTLSAAPIEPAQTVGINGNVPVVGTQASNSAVGNGLQVMNGRYDSTLPSLTSGNAAMSEIDVNGRHWTKNYPDTTTTSYHASAKFAASSTTDNAVMPGNATNTVLVTKVTVTCTETTAGQINVELLKRSTADTSGTSATMTKVPDDANYAAAVSAPLSYTGTGPTVGTAVGDLDNAQVGCMASGTATPNDVYIFRPLKPIVLRGTAQQIAVNVGNAALTGGTLTVTFDWMETTTP